MEIVYTVQQIKQVVATLKQQHKKVGFVPTMGALHQGHVSLIEAAKNENDTVICSIFVNPIQFNDKTDLEKYPRTLAQDIELLQLAHCDIVFAPSIEEMQPEYDTSQFDFGYLDKTMEGADRPGHFRGVAVIVKKFFELIAPDKAYFGEKDYQQLLVIKQLTQLLHISVQIRACPIVREKDGLAMSSRNMHLSPIERKNASAIFRTLLAAKTKSTSLTVEELKNWIRNQINKVPLLQLIYVEVADAETLLPIRQWNEAKKSRALVAVKAGNTRLLDNIALID